MTKLADPHRCHARLQGRRTSGTCGDISRVRDNAGRTGYRLMPGLVPGAADIPLISEICIDRAPVQLRLSGNHVRKSRAEHEARQPFVEGDA